MSIFKKTSTIFFISLASIFFVSCSSKTQDINEIAVTECTIAGAIASGEQVV